MEKDGWEGKHMRGVLLSGVVAVVMIGVLVSQIFGGRDSTTMCRGALRWVVNLGNRYMAGVGLWLIFR